MQFYALTDRSVKQFKGLLGGDGPTIRERPKPLPSPRMHFVKLTEDATAASTDEVNQSEAQLYNWNPTSTPATLGINGLTTVNVWNPHNVTIPSGTLCIIGKFPQGWVIITPVNWCPSNAEYS